jgi:two-component system, response regulator, stage 0 sporulation protein F
VSFSVLVVDDEPDMVQLFRRRFRRELRDGDYVMHFALSGEEALDLLADKIEPEPMLVLSDINMPGMSGLDLLERTKEIHPELPVIMITAYGDQERRSRAFDIGAAGFLAKPIDFDQLKSTISTVVAEGRAC